MVKKGARILVDGALKSTTYENKDGNKVKRVFINANQVSLFDYESKEETTTRNLWITMWKTHKHKKMEMMTYHFK